MTIPNILADVIYASYCPFNKPQDFALEQVSAYVAAGCRVLVTDASPSPERNSAWRSVGATNIVERENTGYDFGSWKDGLEVLLSQNQPGTPLLLTNDSCFGPFSPVGTILEELFQKRSKFIVTAMTDSFERGHHLQSYWLHFQPNTIPALQAFLNNLPVIENRSDAIAHGELALSKFMASKGVGLETIYSAIDTLNSMCRFRFFTGLLLITRKILKRPINDELTDSICINHAIRGINSLHHINPSLGFAVYLFCEQKLPFVKRQLLRENPYNRQDISKFLNLDNIGNREAYHILKCLNPKPFMPILRPGKSLFRTGVSK